MCTNVALYFMDSFVLTSPSPGPNPATSDRTTDRLRHSALRLVLHQSVYMGLDSSGLFFGVLGEPLPLQAYQRRRLLRPPGLGLQLLL